MAKTGENSTNKMVKKVNTIEKLLSLISDDKVIAVTGRMASGKNYISTQLEKSGWASIDADILVHKAIEIAKDTILTTFAPYAKEKNIIIQKADGSIDRRALGELLFSIPGLLQKQESIVYPIITKMIDDFINKNQKAIINATVLFKTPEILNRCSTVIFVDAPLLLRIKRAKKRDNLPLKQILKRFYSQKNLLKNYKRSNKPVIIIKNK